MIVSECEIPKGTSLKGKIYYSKDKNGNIDYSKFINFDTENSKYSAEVISLPEPTDTIKIEYVFSRGATKNDSPYLDDITVYAR